MSDSKMKFRWNGKIVTEKQYKKRLKHVESGKKRKKSETVISECAVEGIRPIELKCLAKHMYCKDCKQLLDLNYIEKENRQGLGSTFSLRCHHCLLINRVPSGQRSSSVCQQQKRVFDINNKSILGTLYAGLGYIAVNNLFQTMDIPYMSSGTYKKYERIVGPIVESVAKDSCEEATKEERALVINKYQELEKKLPEEFQNGFIIPKFASSTLDASKPSSQLIKSKSQLATETMEHSSSSSEDTHEENITPHIISEPLDSNLQSITTPSIQSLSICSSSSDTQSDTHLLSSSFTSDIVSNSTNDNSAEINSNDIVRISVSYDMGYSTRGGGHNYDSLNGYASLIGAETGCVLDYTTRSRKCNLCDNGHNLNDHDCRLNFKGSAKAMEAHAANELCNNSSILKENNVEVGVFTGDNDSSSICAVRKNSDHPILKRSDRNHTTKGVKNMLYKLAQKKEISGLTNDAIKYMHRCFTFAIAQNEGNVEELAKAIRNIPNHVYNQHAQCGEWCGYLKDPQNYTHTTVLPEKFYNPHLHKELIKFFNQIADNSNKFATMASTQSKENLNGIMSRKAPKSICYSRSESADYRYACSVAQKNIRHQYVQKTLQKMDINSGSFLAKHIQRTGKLHNTRTNKANQPEFKKRRNLLKKTRSQLKHAKDCKEEYTYEKNIDLLASSAKENLDPNNITNNNKPQLLENIDFGAISQALVFFDLETSGLRGNCEVLQIAARYNDQSFNRYIDAKYSIPASSTGIHGITKSGSDMFLHGTKIKSHPLQTVLKDFLEFLISCGKKCILIAHNCGFDSFRLIKMINKVNLRKEFSTIVESFSDSLRLFRKKFPKADCSLKTLGEENFYLNSHKVHDANYDVLILQNIVYAHFTAEDLTVTTKNFKKMTKMPENLESLQPLRTVLSDMIIKRMAFEGMNYINLQNMYKIGRKRLIEMLQKKDSIGKKVIRTKKMIINILNHFDQNFDQLKSVK